MSNNTSPSDYNLANQWAQNYNKNPNGVEDGTISWFWIMTVVLLCILVAWWWWSNYYPKYSVVNNESSPMQDLKNGAQNTNSKLQMSTDGNIA